MRISRSNFPFGSDVPIVCRVLVCVCVCVRACVRACVCVYTRPMRMCGYVNVERCVGDCRYVKGHMESICYIGGLYVYSYVCVCARVSMIQYHVCICVHVCMCAYLKHNIEQREHDDNQVKPVGQACEKRCSALTVCMCVCARANVCMCACMYAYLCLCLNE